MGDAQLSGDDARPYSVMGHLYYLMADVIGQRTSVYEDSTELVHAALT